MLKISLNCFVRTCACVKSTIKFAYKVFEIYVLVKKYDSNTMSFIIKDREVNIMIETSTASSIPIIDETLLEIVITKYHVYHIIVYS